MAHQVFKRDINRLVKEKDRLRKIKSGVGKSFWEPIYSDNTESARTAKSLIQQAIDKLHEAELFLRRKE